MLNQCIFAWLMSTVEVGLHSDGSNTNASRQDTLHWRAFSSQAGIPAFHLFTI